MAWGVVVILVAMSSVAAAQTVDHSAGFTGQTDLTLNGNTGTATVVGSNLQITDGQATLARSAFRTLAIPVDKFKTQFTFHLLQGSTGTGVNKADGLGFCLQNLAPTALGSAGGYMGYSAAVTPSVFVKFDNYGGGIAYSATGIYTNGADVTNTGPDINLLTAPVIDFQSEHDFKCVMDYDGTTLTVTLTDLSNNNVRTQTYPVNIPTVLGASTGFVGFCGGTGGLNAVQEVMTWIYLTPPTGLTATPATNAVTLNWNAVVGATSYNVYSSTSSGGPYSTTVATGVVGLTTTDNSPAAYPNPTYYVVRAVIGGVESPNSNQATGTPLPPPVSVSPTSITTSESGTFVDLTLKVNVSPAADGTVQVSSSKQSQALVTGQGQGPLQTITINIPSGTPVNTTYTVRVTGQRDYIDNGDQSYTIDFVVGGGGAPWTGATIPSVTGTNLDIDTAALVINPTSGLVTNTNGLTDTIDVKLNSAPVTSVTIAFQTSDPTEATVSAGPLVFDSNNWDQVQQVTVTGQGTNITYLNAPFTISFAVQNGSDSKYLGMTQNVTGVNIHLEAPPALKKVWGCGLSGVEILLPLGLLALGRRRRRNT